MYDNVISGSPEDKSFLFPFFVVAFLQAMKIMYIIVIIIIYSIYRRVVVVAYSGVVFFSCLRSQKKNT